MKVSAGGGVGSETVTTLEFPDGSFTAAVSSAVIISASGFMIAEGMVITPTATVPATRTAVDALRIVSKIFFTMYYPHSYTSILSEKEQILQLVLNSES